MRYYFEVRDDCPIRDEVGRDFDRPAKAIAHATHLAADLRCLATEFRPRLRVRVVGEDNQPLHDEPVFA